LLARGLGAAVHKGPTLELGLAPVHLTDEGRKDPLLAAYDGAPVMHWHHDTFALPAGATRLAATGAYQNQAFRLGTAPVWGIQFHPEADRQMRVEWAGLTGIDPATVLGDAAVDERGRALARALTQIV
jgi:GMP synthase (glutamine-hydrolysing)